MPASITAAGQISQTPPAPVLPSLREDIALLQGPRSADGNRSWLIHDPVRNAFFRIGWREFEILSQWGPKTAESVAAAIAAESGLETDADEIADVGRFLADNELTILSGPEGKQAWQRRLDHVRNKSFARLFQENLFLRVPLVDPDRFLTATMPFTRVFFSSGFWTLTALVAVIAVLLVIRQWDQFIGTFPYFFSYQGILIYALALTGAKIIHELGHAYAAKRHGLKVPSMGVAFLVFWPVLFTDTTDTWRLRSGRERFIVAGAGMSAEIALAAWALLLWTLVPAGAAQSALFALATATWVLTLAVNLNPLIRFDGYFLLSDAMAVENLQPRSFALLRHYFRSFCLGLHSTDPEPGLSSQLRRGMAAYAVAALIYRIFLAIGIGALLYYFVFKLLGLVALGTVVIVMILQPAVRELRSMFGKEARIVKPQRLLISLAVVSPLLALVFVPWQGTVSAPAILKANAESRIYSPYAARIEFVGVVPGQKVSAGQIIAELRSPDIENRLRTAQARVETFRLLLDRIAFREDIADQEGIARQQLAKAVAEVSGYRAQIAALTLRAPFDGTIAWVPDVARSGNWARPDTALALVVDTSGATLSAYLNEEDISRVRSGAQGRFYAFGETGAPSGVEVVSVAPSAEPLIRNLALASVFGGPIPARATENGQALPENGIYETRFRLLSKNTSSGRELTGYVRIDARTESLARRVWRQVSSVINRESGF